MLFNTTAFDNAWAQFRPPPPSPGHFKGDGPPDGPRGEFVPRLDQDGDNRVSRLEFDGPADQFDVLDRNNDGYLTEDERPGPPPRRRPPFPRSNERINPRGPSEMEQHPGTVEQEMRSAEEALGASEADEDAWRDVAEEASDQGIPVDEPVVDLYGETAQVPEDGESVAMPEATEGTTTSSWPWGLILSAGVALVMAIIWGMYSSRRFRQVKEAVEALNPHLLGVNVDNNIIITEVTDALCRATGFKDRDLIGKPLIALGSHVADKPDAMHDMWARIKKGRAWKGEVKLVRKNGSVIWADAVISPLRRKSEKHSGYAVFYQDVSERKHFEKLSMRDELTNLFNRRYFNEVASEQLAKARREQQFFGLCIIDVDNFKLYNDTYGHPAGDKVLVSIARALTDAFQRKDDMVFRLGGEEFGVVFVVNDREEATAIAKKALLKIRHLRIEHKTNPPGIVTASMGLKIVDANGIAEMEALYKKADQALYKAKQAGRDRFVMVS